MLLLSWRRFLLLTKCQCISLLWGAYSQTLPLFANDKNSNISAEFFFQRCIAPARYAFQFRFVRVLFFSLFRSTKAELSRQGQPRSGKSHLERDMALEYLSTALCYYQHLSCKQKKKTTSVENIENTPRSQTSGPLSM